MYILLLSYFDFQGSISSEEFEELRKVDYEYRRETVMDESEKLKLALDFLGDNSYISYFVFALFRYFFQQYDVIESLHH